ncbi:site-specific DNA-methyltransferase [Anaerovibrio sp.]|uniref:site-specific DNA-methyltransferase n=1 Tax=Anaerovibrio sp. TaxID=1872532 RepID=UPI00388D4E1E
MAGQVQMVYFDPPYGIKYGSNFQPFINKKDVTDKKDEDLSQEPEMIKAFRDTWELGVHSYLSYIRDRLLLARELLNETGSVFVQISDENTHHIREICDEVFGKENFCRQIFFKKTTGQATKLLTVSGDYILWYAKDISLIKYHQLYQPKDTRNLDSYTYIESPDGKENRKMTSAEINDNSLIPKGWRIFSPQNLRSQGYSSTSTCIYSFKGKDYYCGDNNHWKTTPKGLDELVKNNRIIAKGNGINYKRYVDDYPVVPITEQWMDTAIAGFSGEEKIYVVQTATKVETRCMLMTTDPGDLVMDITCGSGTTAYVAEQWGRRWITCDTSRVAIDLAKQRIMTATFDYYKLAHEEQGVGSGFIYKTVPHITLKSIANNTEPDKETLYDQPEIDKTKVRVSGPFTVEALPAPVVKSLENVDIEFNNNATAKQFDWCEELRATGILGKNGSKLEFSRVELLEGTKFVQAEAETNEAKPRRAVICFCEETKTLDSRMVDNVLDEVQTMRPTPQIIVFAAFQFDADAAQMIAEVKWPGLTILKVQMNTDLMTEDLKKKRSSDQSFWLVGQPDVELIKDNRTKNRYKVVVHGFDYYDVKTGKITSGSTNNIAMWMLDTDYDGMCVEPEQVFFPMGGKKDGWNKLAKTLKAEINEELIDKFAGNESIWFNVDDGEKVAVKIIDDRGIESMCVFKVGEE